MLFLGKQVIGILVQIVWGKDTLYQYKETLVISFQFQFSSVSVGSDSATPWITAHQAFLSITNSRSLLKLMFIKSVMPSSHLILCHPLLLLSPIPPSIRVFSNESTLCMRWPKYWSFSFSISPSSEHFISSIPLNRASQMYLIIACLWPSCSHEVLSAIGVNISRNNRCFGEYLKMLNNLKLF